MDIIDDIPSTPSRRRKTALTTENQANLTDIYKTCIKLGTQNKINQKNAWNLTLVDRIQEIDIETKEDPKPAKKKVNNNNNDNNISSHMYNFKMASNTLDASVKIYAYRVDSVHASAYKVLGGLTRNDGQNNNNGEDEEAENEKMEGVNDEKSNISIKEEKMAKKSEMDISDGDEDDENNEENVQKDLKIQKKRQKIHKSLLSGTLETNLSKINIKKIELEAVIDPLFHKTSSAFDKGGAQGLLLNQLGVSEGCNVVFDSSHYQIQQINTSTVDYYDQKVLEGLFEPGWAQHDICPPFSNFSFSNWELNDAISQISKNDIVDEQDFENNLNSSSNNNNNNQHDNTFDINEFDAFDGIQIEPVYKEIVNNIITGQTDVVTTDFDLGKILSGENNEYSYFNKQLMESWKGPDHWKFSTKKGQSQTAPESAKSETKKNKAKKIEFVIDFLAEDKTDYKQYFKKPKKGSTLLTNNEKSSNSSSVTLPDDMHYDINLLTKLFLKPKKSISHRKKLNRSNSLTRHEDGDDSDAEERYDFRINDDEDDEDENILQFHHEVDVDNENGIISNNNIITSNDAHNDEASQSKTKLFDYVDEPNKIEVTYVNFAKRPTKIDVENLKDNIWKEIISTGKDNKNSEIKFSQILKNVPARTPSNQVEDISVPLCFICLLELANKKGLMINSSNNNAKSSVMGGTIADLVVSKYQKKK